MRTQLNHRFFNYLLGGLISTLLIFGLGYYFLNSHSAPSQYLTWASYNWSFDINSFQQPDVKSSGVVIIYLDEKSYKELGEPLTGMIDRRHYADLLYRLRDDSAKAVVLDVIFSDPRPEQRKSDWRLTQALRANGHVVLGADYDRAYESPDRPILHSDKETHTTRTADMILTFPYEPFWKAAAKVGLVQLTPDQDFVIRKHWTMLDGTDLERIMPQDRTNVPYSLSMATAQLIGFHPAKNAAWVTADRWINYYGRPNEAILGIGFSDAFQKSPGFFKNKIVFVGARPMTGKWSELRDEARSPYPLDSISQEFRS